MKEKTHTIISIDRENVQQNPTLFHDKNIQQTGNKENSLNLIKGIYEKKKKLQLTSIVKD